MKSFERVKSIHGKDYLYKVTPYYDKQSKKIRQKSEYMCPVKDGKPVEKSVETYSYGEFIPVMKAVRDLKLDKVLEKIAGEYSQLILVMAMNGVIRPEAMDNIETWFEDSYLSRIYDIPLSSSTLSRRMESIGRMNLNYLFLKEILHITGDTHAMYYDLTSFSSQSREMEFLEYGYSRSDPDLPQVNVSLVESTESEIPVFYDIYPGSIVDITTVKNTVDTLISAGINGITLIMDRGMFSSSNIDYLIGNKIDFIMPASFTLKDVKKVATDARKTIERGKNMAMVSGDIVFAENKTINTGNNNVNAWICYDPKRDRSERISFYSSLHGRIERLKSRKLNKWENPYNVVNDIMSSYRSYISWKYSSGFNIKVKENAVSQRVNRCGITVITYTGEYDATTILERYRKRDSVEKLFLSSKSFLGAEPLRVHSMETLRGVLFLNLVSLAIRSTILKYMRQSKLIEKYSIEKMFLELHKIRKVVLENKEITTEITRKQKEILESFGIKPEHVPTFMKS